MEFGARQCKPKSPNCGVCPLEDSCVALANNTIGILPVKLKKTKVTKKYYNFLVIISKKDTILIEQRQNKGIWQQLYQFPLIESTKPLMQEDIHY